jgi:hypothetical protein
MKKLYSICKFRFFTMFWGFAPRWREIVSRASFGTKDKITARLFNQSFRTPVSCLGSE